MMSAVSDETIPHCYRHPDRETLLACSNCDRPICPECSTPTPVGQRCPECIGKQTTRTMRPRSMASATGASYALVAINVIVFLVLQRGLASGLGSVGSSSFTSDGVLYGPLVATGEWWRLLTAAFLHGSLLHLGFNMYALWAFGPMLEARYGTPRFLALYLAGALGGSAGALLLTPNSPTLGASGAIFGLMAALFVIERRHGATALGGAGGVILMNLLLTFAIPGISIGGHLGGLVGGLAAGIVLELTQRRGVRNAGLAAVLVLAAVFAAVGLALAKAAI